MDILSIVRDTWRITWKGWQLWVLSLLMFVTMVPAVTLAGLLGGAAGFMSLSLPGYASPLDSLRELPAWAWVLVGGGLWAVLVLTTAASWILQVATVRGASLAAEPGALTLAQALRLGRQRLVSIIKLSLTFGVLMMAIAVLPPLAAIVLSVPSRSSAGSFGLLQLTQTGLAPINSALSLALFLVMMSIAVEDLTPLKAFRRTWSVLRYGWWGFLLVFALSLLPVFALLLLILPLAAAVPFAFFVDNGWIIPALCGLLLTPIGLFVLLFTAVFTTTMYTLIYRASARLSEPGALPATVPVA